MALVAKHKLCRNCFKERYIGRDCKDNFATDKLLKALIIYSKCKTSKPKPRSCHFAPLLC